jgi:predicted metal-dependent hydrolase
MSNQDHGAKNGVRPHFQLDFLAFDAGGENADRPLSARDSLFIRVSSRAKRLSVRVFPDARVEVVVPPRVRPREVEQFIAAHREWIEARRATALRNRPEPQPFPPATIEFASTGEQWRLDLTGGAGRARLAASAVGERVLRATGNWSGAILRAALRGWLLRAARQRLAPRVAALAAAAGVAYSKVSIRRQRSRWGSCSARGTISLNCCLLFQRPEVVDYLIVHELMHVKHMNHSARFWQAVERQCADWRALDRELVQGWRHVPRWVFSEE